MKKRNAYIDQFKKADMFKVRIFNLNKYYYVELIRTMEIGEKSSELAPSGLAQHPCSKTGQFVRSNLSIFEAKRTS